MNTLSFRPMRYGLTAIASLAFLAYAGSATAQTINSSNPFTKGDLVVSQVGTGSAALTSASTAVILDEFTTSGSLAGTLALPTTAGGGNNPFTTSGTAGSEGSLSLSADGTALLIAGYDAAPGVASISGTTAAADPREVAVINVLGAVDDKTTLGTDFTANNPRGAASPGGTGSITIYAAGASAPGLATVTQDSTSGGTAAETGFTNVQDVSDDNVAGSTNLYFSTRSGTTGIYVDASPSATSHPTLIAADTSSTGTAAGTGNPYAFYFTPDGSYLYVADNSGSTKGAILKYSAPTTQGNPYAFDYALTQATTADTGILGITGLTGVTTGTGTSETTTLYGVDTSTLFSVFDNDTTFTNYASLATAGTNEAFKGIELSPTPEPSQFGMLALMGLGLGGLILRAKKKQVAA